MYVLTVVDNLARTISVMLKVVLEVQSLIEENLKKKDF